ncbi:MAG: hypothetical protein WCJ92_03320 [Alphaproteobacteria bacterium]
MKAKFILLLLITTIFNYAIGADTTDGILLGVDDDIEAAIGRPRAPSSLNTEGVDTIRSNDSSVIAHRTGIREQVVTDVHNLLSADYGRNVSDILNMRWFFRKVANCSEALGNVLLYVGSGGSAMASGVKLVEGSDNLMNILLFGSTACFAVHITFIGIAKCSAREAEEREHHLANLANEVGFKVVPLIPSIEDDANPVH